MEESTIRPVIVSIPHAGRSIPEEVKSVVALSEEEIFDYTDMYTEQIFDLENVHKTYTDIARIIVDPNRAPDDVSTDHELAAEGVTVLTTWDGKDVYKEHPSAEMMDILVKKYHQPYHDSIEALIPQAYFMFDCHSYLAVAPALKKDSGEKRPDINLGNLNYSSCSREHTVFIRDFLLDHGYSVTINKPYAGKYILGHHCHRRRIPPFLLPGIQIELNQGMYTTEENAPIPARIEELKHMTNKLIDAFIEKWIQK